MRQTAIILLAGFLFAPLEAQECAAVDSVRSAQERAIACAEAFITGQGYTSSPPTVDSASIAYELWDLSLFDTWRGVLQGRHGELAPKAVGICSDSANYIVAFKRVGASTPLVGRAVQVRTDFHTVRMVHQDWSLQVFTEPGCRAVLNR